MKKSHEENKYNNNLINEPKFCLNNTITDKKNINIQKIKITLDKESKSKYKTSSDISNQKTCNFSQKKTTIKLTKNDKIYF